MLGTHAKLSCSRHVVSPRSPIVRGSARSKISDKSIPKIGFNAHIKQEHIFVSLMYVYITIIAYLSLVGLDTGSFGSLWTWLSYSSPFWTTYQPSLVERPPSWSKLDNYFATINPNTIIFCKGHWLLIASLLKADGAMSLPQHVRESCQFKVHV